MKINFSKSAVKDLNSIKEYIYKNNVDAAKEVVAHIIKQIENILALNPAAGRQGRILGTREFIITKYPYIIPYRVEDNVIYILRVLHTSRKWL